MEAKIETVRYLPSFASARKPPSRPRRLRVPMKLVTTVADLAEEMCKSPTKYVTRFIDIPITHILSESSVPAEECTRKLCVIQIVYQVLEASATSGPSCVSKSLTNSL